MKYPILAVIALSLLFPVLFAAPGNATTDRAASKSDKQSVIMDSMLTELDRNFSKLKNAGDAPLYYLGYRLYDTTTIYINGEYGALKSNVEPTRKRTLRVDLRVGSPEVDNTHKVRDSNIFGMLSSLAQSGKTSVPLEDDAMAMRHALWLETDKNFRKAQNKYARVVANKDVKVTEEDSSADFSKEDASVYSEPEKKLVVDVDKWKKRIKSLSAMYRKYPHIYDSSVVFIGKLTKRYLVNSEGTRIEDSRTDFRVYTTARARAEDGMVLWLYDDAETTALGEIDDSRLEKMVASVASNLTRLRKAPKAKPFAGPAILKSKAAGVFFHEVFGHRMEGHRQKDEKEGRTFTKSIGKRVMPSFISVLDDPTRERMGSLTLNGYYRYDDEGVPAQKVVLVDKGVLKSFLMARSPVKGFPKSNGHGRCAPTRDPVARMGNLIVESDKTVSEDELRAMLIEEVKKQGKAYGLIFDDIAGGFTLTSTYMPQVYSLQPLVVTKVFADGRPDELVRGVKVVGTPLTALEKIICTSDSSGTFNGVCGAESGSVPVSASSPSLLVTTLEVELKDKHQDKPPLLPPPLHDKQDKGKDKTNTGS